MCLFCNLVEMISFLKYLHFYVSNTFNGSVLILSDFLLSSALFDYYLLNDCSSHVSIKFIIISAVQSMIHSLDTN